MGLKLRWFRARVSFRGSPQDKYETVTGVGFRPVYSPEFPTYTSISEFSPAAKPTPVRPRTRVKRQAPNPEVALKVRSMLSRSLSNVNEKDNLRNTVFRNASSENIRKSPENEKNNFNQTKIVEPPIIKPRTKIEAQNNKTKYEEQEIQPPINQTVMKHTNNPFIEELNKINAQKNQAQKTDLISNTSNETSEDNSDDNEHDYQTIQPVKVTPVNAQPKSILKKPSITPDFIPENVQKGTLNSKINLHDEFGSNESLQEFPIAIRNLDNDNISQNTSTYSSREEILPPVNYKTMPTELNYGKNELDNLISFTDDETQESDFESDGPYAVINKQSYDDDKPYVISIEEGTDKNDEVQYSEVQKERKQKKSIQFEDTISIINDDDDDDGLYDTIVKTLEKRERLRVSLSEESTTSSEPVEGEEKYGNDYANTKRTSYFQAGETTYSSQAASIFFGNRKPVAERRPTQRFEPDTFRRDSDLSNISQTSA